MEMVFSLLLAAALIWSVIQWLQSRSKYAILKSELAASQARANKLEDELASSISQVGNLRGDLEKVRPYLDITDAVAEASRIKTSAEAEALVLRRESQGQARERIEKADTALTEAGIQAKAIIEVARARAEEIAGDAYKAVQDAEHYTRVVDAMKNKIEGYGDQYLTPTYSILDELADAYDFAEAGQELKRARERSKFLADQGQGATCEYVEANRRETAIRFVLDAFNGKVDSILSRTKSDNAGKLKQQIVDAAALVNHNGHAFRNARITEDYLKARLEELKWATAAMALQERDREEQRRIKAQIRDEERAQREFERAQREAQKEEAAVKKAIAKMEEQLLKATDDQRAKYELQLAELSAKLGEAEAKNQRALSMAQLTKAGHVYIISNVGSFGETVYKIGMTRRLEPLDRVRELGDASVPFAFDVHAIIRSDDAPRLERDLHRKFLISQVNKVNPRKEFFRLEIGELKSTVEQMGYSAVWTVAAEAAEFRESTAIEKQITSDPVAREHWLKHQMLVDPVTVEEDEDSEVATAMSA